MKPAVREVFAARLKALRRRCGVSQQQVADSTHIGLMALQHYEQGYYPPRAEALVSLADYFGVSIDYLLERIDNDA